MVLKPPGVPFGTRIPALALFWFASQSNMSFDTEDEGAQLPIATHLAAAGKDSVVGRKGESVTSGVRHGTPIPRGASVSTNIDAGPTEWRGDRYVGSRRPRWWGGHGKISCESLPTEQPTRQSNYYALHTRLLSCPAQGQNSRTKPPML